VAPTPPAGGGNRGRGRPSGKEKRDTREYLLEVSRQVLAERGFGGATIREIAERAGVNPALLHYYFGTKTGLNRAVIGRVYERLRAQLGAPFDQSVGAREQLSRLIQGYVQVIGSEPYVTRMLIDEMLRSSTDTSDHFTSEIGELVLNRLNSLIELGVSTGEFRRVDLPFESVGAQLFFFFLLAPLTVHAAQGRDLSQDVLGAWAERATSLIFYGLYAKREE
jgi:AcrR family transcriptional regulator